MRSAICFWGLIPRFGRPPQRAENVSCQMARKTAYCPKGYAWIKAPNAAFGGVSALDVMGGGELTDLMRVRRYLDAEHGGW